MKSFHEKGAHARTLPFYSSLGGNDLHHALLPGAITGKKVIHLPVNASSLPASMSKLQASAPYGLQRSPLFISHFC